MLKLLKKERNIQAVKDANTKRLLREYKIHRESNLYQAAMDLIMRANQKTMEEAENMVCDVIKEIFEDEWKEKERQFQEKESQFQEKKRQFQEKESQFQEKKRQFQEKESQFQEKEMRLKKQENRMETLVQYLLKNDLLDELNKISLDRTYREQLYQRYGL